MDPRGEGIMAHEMGHLAGKLHLKKNVALLLAGLSVWVGFQGG